MTHPYSETLRTYWYLDLLNPIQIPPDGTDKSYKIPEKYNMRPDLAAYELWGSSDYWWCFMKRNMDLIKDPIRDFSSGKVIIIPTSTRIKQLIG